MDYSEQSPTHCVLTQTIILLSNPCQPHLNPDEICHVIWRKDRGIIRNMQVYKV